MIASKSHCNRTTNDFLLRDDKHNLNKIIDCMANKSKIMYLGYFNIGNGQTTGGPYEFNTKAGAIKGMKQIAGGNRPAFTPAVWHIISIKTGKCVAAGGWQDGTPCGIMEE